MSRPSAGFTLIEVLIAIAVLAAMGGLVFGSFGQAYRQKEEVEAADERISQVRGALDLMAREISLAFLSEHYDRERFRERPTFFRGDDRGRQDELTFTAMANVRFMRDEKVSDQGVFKYFLDKDPTGPFDSLWRRTNPIIDEEADRRGTRAVLCENVRQLEFEYWDAKKEEWVDEWDTAKPEHNGVLPERVRISLVIVDHNAKEQRYSTQTQIVMQRSLDF